jgi:GntR family transcriptional regulator, sialic acid-inducible nan operon repressor
MLSTTIIHRQKLSEEVVNRIEAMINSGQFRAGDQLPSERELMKLFGVGRPAIREGLFSLQKMGLVVVGNGARARVTRPTPAVVVKALSGAARHLLAAPGGIAHFQAVRMFFEIGLAREAARHATVADIEELRAALAANREAIDNANEFDRTDAAFHYVLAVIPRNPIYTAIHEGLVEWLTEQRRITSMVPGANEAAHRAHKKVYEAIARRNPDAAEKAMRSHLAEVSSLYWKVRGKNHDPLYYLGGLSPETRNVRSLSTANRGKR